MKLTWLYTIIIAIVLTIFLSGCSDKTYSRNLVMELTPKNVILNVGEEKTIKVVNGSKVLKSVVWEIIPHQAADDIVEVISSTNQEITIRALKTGKVKVRATYKDFPRYDECIVAVI